MAYRTPGFSSWQYQMWLAHCTDACAYLGEIDSTELPALSEAQKAAVHRGADNYKFLDVDDLDGFINRLAEEPDLSAHLFRCFVCSEFQSYIDRG